MTRKTEPFVGQSVMSHKPWNIKQACIGKQSIQGIDCGFDVRFGSPVGG